MNRLRYRCPSTSHCYMCMSSGDRTISKRTSRMKEAIRWLPLTAWRWRADPVPLKRPLSWTASIFFGRPSPFVSDGQRATMSWPFVSQEHVVGAGGISSRKNMWETGQVAGASTPSKPVKDVPDIKGGDFSSRKNQWLKVTQQGSAAKKTVSVLAWQVLLLWRTDLLTTAQSL